VFTKFNCVLVTTQDISIEQVLQIGDSTNGIRETSKFNGTSLSSCSKLWCLLDSIVHLSKLKKI